MNMNMIIGKKQIILGALVLGLGMAVYLNWQFAQNDGDFAATGALEAEKSYGDAQLVDSTEINGDTEAYFAEAKMTRQKARDEASESLKEMLADADLDTEVKAQMTIKATEIAQSIEQECKIENLIKAKGIQDCMVYYDTQKVDVVVKTEGLAADEVAVMKDIILDETSIPVENISIVEVN